MKKHILLFLAISCIISGVALVMFLNSDYYYAKKLVHAVEMEDIAVVEQILRKHPHCVNTYPQILPERIFNTIVEDRGMDYPLSEACETGNFEIIKALVEAGADPNCNAGYPPLSITYLRKRDNWYQISLYLIENGASLDYTTESSGGKSVALIDIMNCRPGGADPEYVPESEEEVLSAFYYAIKHCDHTKVNWFRVLQRGISSNRIEIVDYLLNENYCNINDTDSSGWTVLMQAVTGIPKPEMVQFLLDKGADKGLMDSKGKTAYDYAIENGNTDIAFLLAN